MAYKKLKYWFDRELALLLAEKINREGVDFNKKRFVQEVEKETSSLELKDRVELICDKLHFELGADYPKGIEVLISILGPENKKETGMFKEFYWIMPIAKYVEKYGLKHFELSMDALAEITKRNTSEYAIRPFLKTYTDKTLLRLEKWSRDKNFHIRRLSSEGVRPRLPWAPKLDVFISHPQKIFPILDNLKDDKIKYVQKSVANCINDILKDNLEIGKELINQWSQNDSSKERKWIIKHALRKLVKAEDKWAISLLTM